MSKWLVIDEYILFHSYRYQIAVGTSPGGGQVKAFYTIPSGSQYHTISGLNLNGYRKVNYLILLNKIFSVAPCNNSFLHQCKILKRR